MNITTLRRYVSALTLLALLGSATAFAQQNDRPNVVFILADNVGYGDLGSYGGGELRGAPTPRLDAMAQEGLRLHAIPSGTGVHTVTRRADDGAVLNSQRPIADCHRRYSLHASRARVHHG